MSRCGTVGEADYCLVIIWHPQQLDFARAFPEYGADDIPTCTRPSHELISSDECRWVARTFTGIEYQLSVQVYEVGRPCEISQKTAVTTVSPAEVGIVVHAEFEMQMRRASGIRTNHTKGIAPGHDVPQTDFQIGAV